VETDGFDAHAGPLPFQADRTHSNTLQLNGWLILRFTWQDLTQRARTVAKTVRAALAP
jgi:very-short-patch-repair endonuclease